MQFRTICAALCVLLALSAAFADPPDTMWHQAYGGAIQDTAYSAYPTSDGGFIIAGITNSAGAGDWDGWLVKTDSAGNVEWDSTYGTSYAEGFFDVVQTADGEYIASGWTEESGTNTDYWLIRVDALGDEVWSQTYGGGLNDTAFGMIPAHNGNYLVCGYTWSLGPGADGWVLEFDPATGDTLWSAVYDPGSGDILFSGCQTPEGGYLFAGTSVEGSNWDAYVVKIDSLGEVIWSKIYGWSPGYERAYSACPARDGGYILVATTNQTGSGGMRDAWILKLTEEGDTAWTRLYGGEEQDMAYGVCQDFADGYVISGFTYSFGEGGSDGWLLGLDADGDTTWSMTCGGESDDGLYFAIRPTEDSSFVTAGYTASYGAGGSDFWLVNCGYKPEPGVAEDMTASPIGITTTLNRLSYEIEGSAQLILYSADGRKVSSYEIFGSGTFSLDLTSGVYFARVTAAGINQIEKLVIIR